MEGTRTYRFYDWVGRHTAIVVAAVLLVVIGLGVAGPILADTEDADFDPGGEIFDVAERADRLLSSDSTIRSATFIVEAADSGDVLTASAFREWSQASDRVRRTPGWSVHLVEQYDTDGGATVPGVLSVVDLVAATLPLETATDAEVKTALAAVLADGSPFADMRFSLSEHAAALTGPGGAAVWTSPAFTTQVMYDAASFATFTDSEAWLRDVQAEFRASSRFTDSIGLAIDGDLTFGEAAQQSAPYIFLAVALIILLVAAVHRSYWSAVIVAAGLTATTLAYYGTAALLGLKMGSILLAFVVPIAMISFGVDFYIHGAGRVREMQVEGGLGPAGAYPAGMAAVFVALLLAVSSSIAAFLANAVSATEAIVQFGMGAALSLLWAYLILGQLAPRVLLAIESFVGNNPVKRASRIAYAVGMLVVAVLGGLAVALGAVMPAIGVGAFVAIVLIAIAGPALLTRSRNRRAVRRGREVRPPHRGAAHGLRLAGTLVHGLAKHRFVTIPVVFVIGLGGLWTAFQVQSGFEITDFLSADTDFVRSIERADAHFGSAGQGSSFILVEGDLTDPGVLAQLDSTVASIDGADLELGRDAEGGLLVQLHAGDLVRMTMASPPAVAEITAAGVDLTDLDGNGIPETAAGVRAIYDAIATGGVLTADGAVAISPDDVAGILYDDGALQATALIVQVGSFTDADVIVPVREGLEAAAADLEAGAGVTARVSGEVLTQFYGMEAFTRQMLISLPLAVVLTLLLATVLLKSLRFALVAVIPIGFVVTGVYAFMAVAGYQINVVTATIAAIAVGVGIDFSTHFTARYREELDLQPTRLAAVRRAGAGTGGALVLSAMTSVLGFLVMALAPTPIFATFGTLTAVMIALALLAALVVLPSMLVVATRERPSAPQPDLDSDPELVAV